VRDLEKVLSHRAARRGLAALHDLAAESCAIVRDRARWIFEALSRRTPSAA
jgi:hypothetical protein